jgi:hypothetical protein
MDNGAAVERHRLLGWVHPSRTRAERAERASQWLMGPRRNNQSRLRTRKRIGRGESSIWPS